MTTPPPWDIGESWAEPGPDGTYVLTPKPARTCPACGETLDGGCHPCSGPPGYEDDLARVRERLGAPPGGTGQYDPVPHLARLLDEVRALLDFEYRHATDIYDQVGRLATGAYAALRGGLLLDEPELAGYPTVVALRAALAEYERRQQP